jgi:prophage tail gpP-like protein
MTGFEAIQKLCSLRSCLAISDGKGGILITRAGTEKLSDSLTEGQIIKSGQAKYDVTERFSQYIVKGQKQGTDNLSTDAITKAKAVVEDENVTRYRPLIIVADGETSTKDCQLRARWEATVRRGKSRTFTIAVNGWKAPSGQLWPLNKLIAVKSPLLGVDDTLLIVGTGFKLDNGGEITDLTLMPADAYAVIPDDKIKKKKGKGKGAEGNPYISG